MDCTKFKEELFASINAYETKVPKRLNGQLVAFPSSLFSETIEDMQSYITDELRQLTLANKLLLIEELCQKDQLVFLDIETTEEEKDGKIIITYYGWDVNKKCTTTLKIEVKPKTR